MPKYLYQCAFCETRQTKFFNMNDIPDHVKCANMLCEAVASRVFTVPQITANPHHLREENRLYGEISSERDRNDARRKDDKLYDERAASKMPDLDYEPNPF